MKWQITKIEVLNPIKWMSVRRNEVGAVASMKSNAIYIDELDNRGKPKNRLQRNTLMLKDVRYRIWAKLVYIPVRDRPKEAFKKHTPGKDENPMKYYDMFERRAFQGQCFTQPYLGCRECAASFKLICSDLLDCPIQDTKDFGLMLYDKEYISEKNVVSKFFHAEMKNGIINCNEKEISIWY